LSRESLLAIEFERRLLAERGRLEEAGGFRAGHRKLHEERRALSLMRFEPYSAAVLLDDGKRHPQPEYRTFAELFRREKRIEDLRLHFVRNARTVVVDL